MADTVDVKSHYTRRSNELATGDIQTKRELAKRLMKGEGINKNETQAVILLEECAALGDADAMLMLAKCCALGCGMEQNAGRAKALISEASLKGNKEASSLMKLINEFKEKEGADMKCR